MNYTKSYPEGRHEPRLWRYSPLRSLARTPVSIGREWLHRLPWPGFGWHFAGHAGSGDIPRHLQELRQNGYTLLPAYFRGAQLERLQLAFRDLLRERPAAEKGIDAESSLDMMDFDPVFMEVALDDCLLEIIARYYGKPFALGRAEAMRLHPTRPQRYGSWRWHHDAKGSQIKAQVLLTDVAADGQRMSYLKGSHRRYYSYYRMKGDGSRYEEDFQHHPEYAHRVVEIHGPAGTVCLFDTNGLHSGNRNDSAARDSITFYYPTAWNYRPVHCRLRQFENLPANKQQVLLENPEFRLVGG